MFWRIPTSSWLALMNMIELLVEIGQLVSMFLLFCSYDWIYE